MLCSNVASGIPTPNKQCTADQNATLLAFRNQFVHDIAAVTDGKPQNGVYLDGCYVHEQNVNYCEGQGMPNCVGWSPQEPGSVKWGYSTAITLPDGRSLTPQQAFGAYYRGDRAAAVAIDQHDFLNNPTCHYLGKPVPPLPPPCVSFVGAWVSNPASKQPVEVSQTGCTGSFTPSPGVDVTFNAHQAVLTTSKNFFGGLTGTLEHVSGGTNPNSDMIAWSNGANWTRTCSNFAGKWCDYKSCPEGTANVFTQTGCSGTVTDGARFTFTVAGNVLTASKGFYNGLAGTLELTAPTDLLKWGNGANWYRNHTA